MKSTRSITSKTKESKESKESLRKEAYDLYVKKGLSLDTIFRILPDGTVSRKTLYNWRDEGNWGDARRAYFNRAASFEESLWGLAENYAKAAEATPDPQLAYAIGSLMSALQANQKLAQAKKSEAIGEEDDSKPKSNVITLETINKIREMLGVQ